MNYVEKACGVLLIGILLVISLILLAINNAKSKVNGRKQGIVVQDQRMEKSRSRTNTYEYTIFSD